MKFPSTVEIQRGLSTDSGDNFDTEYRDRVGGRFLGRKEDVYNQCSREDYLGLTSRSRVTDEVSLGLDTIRGFMSVVSMNTDSLFKRGTLP